jgi:L-alanine-DL-glutamate epimerase-like enolase superfamily enzyme
VSKASGSRPITGITNIRGTVLGADWLALIVNSKVTRWFFELADFSKADKMKITDLRCAIIGRHPIVRIVTDEGLYGLGEVEYTKPYLKPFVLQFRDALIGMDPTDVEFCMLKIRQRGSFKPHGAAVSAIEHALWDIAGKAAGVPVYKLLGGKVREKVRVYNGSLRQPKTGTRPEDYAQDVKWMMELPEGFFMVKQGISFHSNMKRDFEGFHYGIPQVSPFHGAMDTGLISERGMNHMIDCVIAMKEVLGDKVGLALDCGPGWMLPDAIRFARAVEKYNLMWLEDMLTGDYTPWVNPQAYRELTTSTSTPIHTGEQIYLRHNFKELIETQAVNVVGPDPADVGGIAELKWIAEHAHMHSILMAPHGTANGLLGLGALINVCATLPANYIAFEFPSASDPWWHDIVEGLPSGRIVNNSMVDLLEAPGLGLDINAEAARRYLKEEDTGFFD